MKLVYDCTILSNYYTKSGYRAGLFFVAINLLKELQKQGHYIELYCNSTERYRIKSIKELSSFKMIPEFKLWNKAVALMFYFLSFLPIKQPYLNVLKRYYLKYLCLEDKKKQNYLEQFDAYFSPIEAPTTDILNAKLPRFRMIHDVIPLIENGIKTSDKKWLSWYNRIYYTINSEDYYVTNSDYTRKDVLKYFPFIKDSHIKTTLLGANETFKPSLEPLSIEDNFIFSLCSLGKRKNLIFAIRNFYKFIEKNNITDLKLVLGGSIWDRYKNELYTTLNQYDTSKVIVTDYIDESELPKYYSNALCFIYPSLYEGFGLPVLEAMQCGCPVIASNATSLPEVIGDAGMLINPTSDAEMVAAYEQMYFNAEFRENCRRKGFERAKQFGWEKCAKEILDFMQSKI